MNKRIAVLLVTLLVTFAAIAQNQQRPGRARISCGPYVQNVTETGFSVVWESDIDAMAWVELAPDDGSHFYNMSRPKYYDLRAYGRHHIGRTHKVRVEGLEPGVKYRYRVMMKGAYLPGSGSEYEFADPSGSDVYGREPYKVKTLSKEYETIRFDVYNDVHDKDSLLSVLMSGARKNLDFVVLNGDMTSNISSISKVPERYLKTVSAALKGSIPLVLSRGNHEMRGKDSPLLMDYIDTPTGMPYYAFKMGKFFFIALDGCEDKPDDDIEYRGRTVTEPYLAKEAEWLKEVINSKECKEAEVKVVFCHMPPEKNGWKGPANLCKYFVPILNEAGVDIMLSGHLHEHKLYRPEENVSGAIFPVVSNPNVQRMEVTLTEKSLSLKIFAPDGKQTNAANFVF